MSTLVSTPVTNTITSKCDRVLNNGNICGFPSVKTGRHWQNPRCKECVSLCCFVDTDGNSCQDKISSNNYCTLHADVVNQLKEYESWKVSAEFHKNNVYVGSHWETTDEYGPIDIYHYISRERLGSKSINELEEWDYDKEIWLGDKLWPLCGPLGEEKVRNKYPEDFVEKLQLKALVKVKSD